ncbi:MAG: hypothetical protein MJZ33_01745 [Paludibacteraceae bacterium]|nr:hypothetical protein [Paludibacteraceae bacterium]
MMRTLSLFIGLLFIALSSCTPSLFKGMAKEGKTTIKRGELFPLFGDCDSSIVFDTKIDYKTNSFSGMLVMAPADSNAYRLAFTSYFGLTVFDFEIGEKSFVVHHCLEQLDRKAVLSIFEQDFRTLLMLNVPSQCKVKKYSEGALTGYKLKTTDGKCCYLTNTSRKQWAAADKSGMITALEVRMSNYEAGFPKIEMNHPKLGLRMEMEIMKEE